MQNISFFADPTPFLLIVAGAVFVHICFQLSVSTLTLLSSHTIGRRLPNHRLLGLSFWYVLGVGVMVALLQAGLIVAERYMVEHDSSSALLVSLSLIPVIALLVVLFYYRRGRGTQLWLPRPAAEFITTRAKKTRSSVEAFSLGTLTALTELPFAIAPLAITAYVFQTFDAQYWLGLSTGYAVAVITPLVFVAFYLSSGHKISSVQRWRESAKDYLKWTSAITLLLLTMYIAVLQIGVTG